MTTQAKKQDWSKIFTIGVIALVIGLIGSMLFTASDERYSAETYATVSRMEKVKDRDKRHSSDYRVEVSFEDAEGESYTAWAQGSVRKGDCDVGNRVQIRYDPSSPGDRCYVVGTGNSLESGSGISMFVAGAGGIVAAFAALMYAWERRKQTRGEAATKEHTPPSTKTVVFACVVGCALLVLVASVVGLLRDNDANKGLQNENTPATEPKPAKPQPQVERYSTSATVPYAEITLYGEDRKVSGDFDKVGPGNVKAFVLVKNETGENVSIKATFPCRDAAGSVVAAPSEEAEYVVPGEEVLLYESIFRDDIASVSFNVECTYPAGYAKPLQDSISIEETSVSDSDLTVTITNNGTKDAQINKVQVLCTDASGAYQAGSEFVVDNLEPGKSREYVLHNWDMFDRDAFTSWNDFERRYFVSGFVNVY